MMLYACTYKWRYLFVKILQNEIWKFGQHLPLDTFGSERVNTDGKLLFLGDELCGSGRQ